MSDPMRKAASSIGRRRFVFGLGGAGLLTFASSLGLPFGAGDARAQAGGATPATPPATPPAGTMPPAGEAPKISDEAKQLHAVVMARYGKDLDADQTQGLLEAIDGSVGSGVALRKQKLANAVEPATMFAATPLPPATDATAAAPKGGR